MNKVILIGRLTADPELRKTANDKSVASFSLAINRAADEVDFINVVAWETQADNVKKYLVKGSQVAIDGRIQTRNYDDKDGNKKYVTEVVANNIEFVGNKVTKEETAE